MSMQRPLPTPRIALPPDGGGGGGLVGPELEPLTRT
jgi:hypothetical protein